MSMIQLSSRETIAGTSSSRLLQWPCMSSRTDDGVLHEAGKCHRRILRIEQTRADQALIPAGHRTVAQCNQTQSCQHSLYHLSRLRLLRNSATQLRALPSIPNRRLSTSMKIKWSTVSNAADRLSSTKAPMSTWSTTPIMSLCMLITALSVKWNEWYADWRTGSRQCLLMCSESLTSTNFSTTFDRKLRLDMGRYDAGSLRSIVLSLRSIVLFFSTGRTVALLQRHGHTSCWNDALQTAAITGTRTWLAHLAYLNHYGYRWFSWFLLKIVEIVINF